MFIDIFQISQDDLIIDNVSIEKNSENVTDYGNPLKLPKYICDISCEHCGSLSSFVPFEAKLFFNDVIKKHIIPNIIQGAGVIKYTLFRPSAVFVAKNAYVFDWYYPFGVFSYHPFIRESIDELALFSSDHRYLHDQIQKHYFMIYEDSQKAFDKFKGAK